MILVLLCADFFNRAFYCTACRIVELHLAFSRIWFLQSFNLSKHYWKIENSIISLLTDSTCEILSSCAGTTPQNMGIVFGPLLLLVSIKKLNRLQRGIVSTTAFACVFHNHNYGSW